MALRVEKGGEYFIAKPLIAILEISSNSRENFDMRKPLESSDNEIPNFG